MYTCHMFQPHVVLIICLFNDSTISVIYVYDLNLQSPYTNYSYWKNIISFWAHATA